ncbi:hypothetical protein KAI04_01925 [Candidatus Pacearchaeota archaeon]|nr:hypothetical protein [Candidatus Pacearchaeota archaeon]
MFSWIFRKKEVEQIKEDTKKGFDSVKNDIKSITEWIKHLDSEKDSQKEHLIELKEVLSSMNEEIEGLKNVVNIMNNVQTNTVFKTAKQKKDKQPAVYAVQTGVQTAVQTPNLDDFSITERAILWILLNTEMKLSYHDLAAMLGKEKSTMRGQVNSIRQKSEGLIEEIIEENGKKRVYVPENLKEKMLKKTKVRVKKSKKT